jgi:FAD/FMN-containing dehydrogenase
MSKISRRLLLSGAGTAAVGLAVGRPAFAAEPDTATGRKLPPGLVSITPSDPRYLDVQLRGYNKRLVSYPESVRIVGTTAHVVQAVSEAVSAGKRIAVRSGGHCLDGLVDNADTQVIIDFTEMRSITFDTDRNAFAIEPGATLGEIYRTLDYGWGVTLPGGVCPVVGAGGHITGNGFGALSRQHGLIADHLYAIEVVVVRSDGRVEAVVATRDANDPNRELWWAHTGAGGGNFGVVTRFWMRSANTTSTNPGALLPKAPNALMSGRAVFNWADLTEAAFVQLVKNWGTWVEQNSAPGSKGTQLHGAFSAPRKEKGLVFVVGQVDPTISGNEALLDSYLAAMKQGVAAVPTIVKSGKLPWLSTTINVPDSSVAQGITGPPRWKSKVGHLRAKFTDQQVAIAYRNLTRTDYANPAASFSLTTYGGQINALAPSATATPHRFTLMMASVSTAWDVPADDDKHLRWAREFYRDLFAATGGVPVPNDQADGLHVNWPDLDLTSQTWNTSGYVVQKLLHKENYPRLQQVKAKWDPRNVFRHGVSVELP